MHTSQQDMYSRKPGLRTWFRQKKVNWASKCVSRKLELDAHQREKLGVFVQTLMEQRQQPLMPPSVRISDILKLEGIDQARLVSLTEEALLTHKQNAKQTLAQFDQFYASLTETQRQRVRAYVDRWQYRCQKYRLV